MEPTTVIALRSMEKAGLIRRVRSTDDRRVTHVRLTAKAKRMRDGLLQLARSINAQADEGISAQDIAAFRRVITRMTKNLDKVGQ
jgi:MarR family transcriptional regulator for hemolysin